MYKRQVQDLQKHFNLASQDIEKITVSSKKIATSGRKLNVLEQTPDPKRIFNESND